MSIVITKDKSWKVVTDSEGILFSFVNEDVFKSGVFSKASPLVQERAASLRILEEQGLASSIHGGMKVPWVSVCQLSTQARELLELPLRWPGRIVLRVAGRSSDQNFDIFLDFHKPNGDREESVQTSGGLIVWGDSIYLACGLQYRALEALAEFKALGKSGDLDQYAALSSIQILQECSRAGLEIDLEAYDELEISKPDAVRVSLEELEDGGLSLLPDLCKKVDGPVGANSIVNPSELEVRIEEYIRDRETACVPVGRKLVLLDEKSVKAIREITRNQRISAKDRDDFLAHPTAWINAEYVDLDLGFSDRVRGAGQLRVAYFGETDESGIEWVDASSKEEDTREEEEGSGDEGQISEDLESEEDIEDTTNEPIVLDIELSDQGESPASVRSRQAPEIGQLSASSIDTTKLKRTPYPHQDEGIRWLLELALSEERWPGGLLADDMGLGKTFTVLAFLREYFSAISDDADSGPVLIVAPVTLLTVWHSEIEKTYIESPFEEIVKLHSSGDLSKYRKEGAGRETTVTEPESNAGEELDRAELNDGIRYALRVPEEGEPPRPGCLGVPGMIVITNYETVRDYQFSLARIPWSVVVLDEAQAVKNPNAIATRAVKALRADFTVVMTGTPVENTLRDFWCLMDRVAPGYLNNYQPFRQEFIAPILQAKRSGDGAAQVRIRNEIGERLRERVGGLMLRRLKENHLKDLPNKEVILHKNPSDSNSGFDERILCEMSGEQKQLYDGICSQEHGDEESDRSDRGKSVLGAIQNLRAVSLHPDLVLKDSLPCPKKAKDAEAYLRQSAKLSLLLEILNQISERREKVLIFVINKNLQALLRSALQLIYNFESPIEVINGDTKVATSRRSKSKSRTELIDEFSEREGFGILILSPLAAGVGLTITEANHVIHLERHWNPAKEAQATDRVYRIGQKKPVSVWVPILTHPDRKSFDVNLNQLLSMKSGLSDAVITPEVVDPNELASLLGDSGRSDDGFRIKIDELSGLKWSLFEALVALLVEQDGAEQVILTGKQGDKGCDVVAIGWRGENWLIQCKHHRNPSSRVGRKCIQEIVGSRRYVEQKLDRRFPKLAVFSNVRKFDKDAKQFSELEKAELFGMKQIRRLFPSEGILFKSLIERDAAREVV